MSAYHVYECDRCGVKVKEDSLPQYWAKVNVNDTNRTSTPDSGVYEKSFCSNCMNRIRQEMERIPEVRAAGAA